MSDANHRNFRLGDLLMSDDEGPDDAGGPDVPLADLVLPEPSDPGDSDISEGFTAGLDFGSGESASIADDGLLSDLDPGLVDAGAATGSVEDVGPKLDASEDLTAGLDFGSAEACVEPEGAVDCRSTLDDLTEAAGDLGRRLENALELLAEADPDAAVAWYRGHLFRIRPIILRDRS